MKVIAMVEDFRPVMTALKLSLEDAGYAVIAGSSGEIVAGMLALKNSVLSVELHAVVADYRLERGICGISVISCFEKLYGKCFKAVLITGDTDPALADHATMAGLTLLHKPFKLDELLAVIGHP